MQEKGRASICLLRCLPRPSTLSSTAEPKAEQLFTINSSTLNIASMTLPWIFENYLNRCVLQKLFKWHPEKKLTGEVWRQCRCITLTNRYNSCSNNRRMIWHPTTIDSSAGNYPGTKQVDIVDRVFHPKLLRRDDLLFMFSD